MSILIFPISCAAPAARARASARIIAADRRRTAKVKHMSIRECGNCEIETARELAGNSERAPALHFDAVIAAARYADDQARRARAAEYDYALAVDEVGRAQDALEKVIALSSAPDDRIERGWVESAKRRRSDALDEKRRTAAHALGARGCWRVLLDGAR